MSRIVGSKGIMMGVEEQNALVITADERRPGASPSTGPAVPSQAGGSSSIGMLKATGGMLLLGLFFFALYALLHPNPAFDAAYSAGQAVALQLKDAESASYRKVNVFRLNDGHLLVCGEVNARNSFGALAGYTRFIAPAGKIAIIETNTGSPEEFDEPWLAFGCDGQKGELIATDVSI